MHTPHHRARARIHEADNLAARVADAVTAFAGSIPFIAAHALWFGAWLLFRVERYPFGLLTLIVSLEAIFLSSLVLLSQQRSYERDKKRDDLTASEVHLLTTHGHNQAQVLRDMQTVLNALHDLNRDQMAHLRAHDDLLAAIKGLTHQHDTPPA